MTDIISPALLNGIGVVGLVLGGGFFLLRAFLRGDFITRREADVYIQRAESAEADRSTLLAQQTELAETHRLLKGVLDALRKQVDS